MEMIFWDHTYGYIGRVHAKVFGLTVGRVARYAEGWFPQWMQGATAGLSDFGPSFERLEDALRYFEANWQVADAEHRLGRQ